MAVCKTSYDSFDFIAGNRLFRYTMEVTGPHYTRGEITVCVYGQVCVCVCVLCGACSCLVVYVRMCLSCVWIIFIIFNNPYLQGFS